MKTNYIASDTRGITNREWVKTFHTYSFGDYHDPQRMGFGVLRSINDLRISPAKGFDMHLHKNIEIISIPIAGKLAHEDSIGNKEQITEGEVEAMTAGSDIMHSEMNGSEKEGVKFLRIEIDPREQNLTPTYNHKKFDTTERHNKWQLIVAPDTSPEDVVKIYQDAWVSIGNFDSAKKTTYKLRNPKNGVFIFVIEGVIHAGGHTMDTRDGVEISETDLIEISIPEKAQLLIIEVPL